MEQWIPIVASVGAAIVAGGFALRQSLLQWDRSSRREAEKELNSQRLQFYPEVQKFMAGIYGAGWSGAMKEKGRLQAMMELSNKLISWASDDTLLSWIKVVDNGQRGKLSNIVLQAELWTELAANMRKDLGYGKEFDPAKLYPILFSPDTVDEIREETSQK